MNGLSQNIETTPASHRVASIGMFCHHAPAWNLAISVLP
jgi:hypothetical protein